MYACCVKRAHALFTHRATTACLLGPAALHSISLSAATSAFLLSSLLGSGLRGGQVGEEEEVVEEEEEEKEE